MGARGGTLIYLYIRRLGPFFGGRGGFKILNFNIFGLSEIMNILGGMKMFWIFFFFFWGGGVIAKNQVKSDKLKLRHHKREPRGQPFPSR